jgi:DegV family protein with EDD domain
MSQIRVVADSACDLPNDVVADHQITIVPLTVRFGGEDGTDLSPEQFWAKCRKTEVVPETAAPAPGAFAEVFRRLADDGADGVVCVTLSSKMSATIQSAQAAAREVADRVDVRVIDSLSVSYGMGFPVLEGARMAAAGKTLDEVADAVRSSAGRMRVFATLDTLENLKKGGRIGGAQAFLGSMLSIKPVIEVADGSVEQESKQRTRGRALRYLVDKVFHAANSGQIDQLAVMHGDAPDVDQFVEQLSAVVPRNRIIIGWVGPVIGAHAGPGVMAVAWEALNPGA